MNLKPAELGVLTHGEFLELYEGWKWRDKNEMEKLAQSASWLTAPHLKRPIDPKKLLEQKKEKKKTNPKKTKAVLNDLMQKLGVS